jgi:hypothetical protein
MENSMSLRPLAYVALAGSAALLAGCGSYYMVRDPGSGNTYYTSDINRPGDTGTVRFRDGRSDRQVTLQNSEVHEISHDEYRQHINEK